MTPADFEEFVKAFGVSGAALLTVIYLLITRKNEAPGRSRLEEDVSAMREELREIRDRIAHMEGRMEGKR